MANELVRVEGERVWFGAGVRAFADAINPILGPIASTFAHRMSFGAEAKRLRAAERQEERQHREVLAQMRSQQEVLLRYDAHRDTEEMARISLARSASEDRYALALATIQARIDAELKKADQIHDERLAAIDARLAFGRDVLVERRVAMRSYISVAEETFRDARFDRRLVDRALLRVGELIGHPEHVPMATESIETLSVCLQEMGRQSIDAFVDFSSVTISQLEGLSLGSVGLGQPDWDELNR